MSSATLELVSTTNAMTSAASRQRGRYEDPALQSWTHGGSGVVTGVALLSDARAKLNRLTHLESGWDGHRGSPTQLLPAMVLNGVLGSLVRDDQPTPQVAPMPDGGVQVAWLVNGHSVEIEVSPEGQVVVLAFDEASGAYELDQEFEYHRPDLGTIEAVRRILNRLATGVRVRVAAR